MIELADTSFNQRRHAAITLVHAGELDGDLALSYVLWPRLEDIPKNLTLFAEVAKPDVPLCPTLMGDRPCGAEADPILGLCEDHFWAFMSGEDFDFWGAQAA